MDNDKSILEKIADTVKAAADSIVHPTAGTPMEMPLNESGYAITHLKSAPKAKKKAPAKKAPEKTAKKKTPERTAKKSSKKPKSSAEPKGGVNKKTAKKVAKKKKPKKSRR